jgi:hypothetical protein
MAIVVSNEGGNCSLKMLTIQHHQPIQTLGVHGSHKALRDGICLRRSKRRAQDLDLLVPEHLVKTLSEVLIAVADEKADRFRAIFEGPRELSRLLGDPGCRRARRATR